MSGEDIGNDVGREPLRAVLDTNVLVAGLRSARGASAAVLRGVVAKTVRPVVTAAVVLEYEEILTRPGLCPLRPGDAERFLDDYCNYAERRTVYYRWPPSLNDPRDEHVLHAALAAGGCPIVTHNVKDFLAARRAGLTVLTPSEFLDTLAADPSPPPDAPSS
ncbi:putative toxin-antitoxin system toxin component, PIN family [Alienimonas sp. DA493]|uniref:PIN domain-containing protein n=1 Tax=Alienimonas sp. DA493 TaxID=3373605 RepID=UPI003753FB0B